jgi:hypothetical protein
MRDFAVHDRDLADHDAAFWMFTFTRFVRSRSRVVRTYPAGRQKQTAIAQSLGMSRSSYQRYLDRAIRMLAGELRRKVEAPHRT